MKFKILLLVTALISSFSSYSNTGSIANLINSEEDDWGESVEAPAQIRKLDEEGITTNTKLKANVSTSIPMSCTRKDQTTVPQAIFEEYFLSRKKITPHHSHETKILTMNGGMIKANCIEMMSFDFIKPNDISGNYTFQVSIKHPTEDKCTEKEIDVGDGKIELKTVCKFKAYTATNGTTTDDPIEVEVEPNLYGLIQCMKDTGVLGEDGKWNKGKIAKSKFNPALKAASKTDVVNFQCSGPECLKYVKSKRASKELDSGCTTLEKFKTSNGNNYTVYSSADIRKNEKRAELNTLCNEGNYKLVEQRLPYFKDYKKMLEILVKARVNMIEHEVKKLKKEFNKIAKKKDLSKVNIAKYNEVLSDFYTKIIQPLKNQILRDADKLEQMEEGSERDIKQKELNVLIAQLLEYRSKSGKYFTTHDYNRMKDFAYKAPLDKELWRESANLVFNINNTAENLARYNPKYRESTKKVRGKAAKKGLAYMGIDEVQDVMDQQQAEQAEKIEGLGVLAEDKEGTMSIAASYEKDANMVRVNYQQAMQKLQYDSQRLDRVSSQCSDHWCYHQNMFLKSQLQKEMHQMKQPEYQQQLDQQVNRYRNLANQWKGPESARNAAYGIDPKVYQYHYQRLSTPDQMQNQNFAQQFQQRNPYPANPGQGSDYARYMQHLALQRNQQQSQYDLINYGNNSNPHWSQSSQWGGQQQWGQQQWGQQSQQFNRQPSWQGQYGWSNNSGVGTSFNYNFR